MNPKDTIGRKKPPVSALPMTALHACGVSADSIHPHTLYLLGLAFAEGARKYGRHNYRKYNVFASVYYDAAMRHMSSYAGGQYTDPDSGLPHLAKAAASLLIVADAGRKQSLIDDRPPRLTNVPTKDPMGIRDMLSRWWDGLDDTDLGDVVKSIVIRLDECAIHGDEWIVDVQKRYSLIVEKYPEETEPHKEIDK